MSIRSKVFGATLCALLASSVTPAHAAITWNWSFAGEAGTFTTDGVAVSGVAAPGTYNFVDFAVTASPFGRPIGSVSGGQYTPAGFGTTTPYAFNWDGSSVTFWDSAGGNGFDWWVFAQTSTPNLYHFFAWANGNINDPTSAALYDSLTGGGSRGQLVGPVTVAVATTSAVPEPASWAMMIGGFAIAGAALRKRSAVVRFA